MFNIKDHLCNPALFGNDAAEDEESSILNSYFVMSPDYTDFFDTISKLKFVRARKGTGKSALLAVTAYRKRLIHEKPLVISLSGPTLPTFLEENEFNNPNTVIAEWQQRLCQFINIEIGKEIGFAISDTSISMVEIAEISGARRKNLLSALLERLKVRILDSEVTKTNSKIENQKLLLERYIKETNEKEIWLIIDDIDSTFQNAPGEKLTLSAFFSACRSLTRSVNGLFIRGAVRSDTWETIREFDESLDKFDQYLLDIKWTSAGLIKVLAERLRRFMAEDLEQHQILDVADEELVEILFPVKAGWGNSKGRFQLLTQISNGRPRWALQACKYAATAAQQRNTIISRKIMKHILPKYGNLRIKDLISEYSNKISGLREVITHFSYRNRGYTSEQLIEHCNLIISALKITLNGEVIDNGRILARFLFSTGFLNGRKKIDGRFYQFTFDEEPFHLLTDYNPFGDNVNWEVQSAYQRALQLTNVAPHLL